MEPNVQAEARKQIGPAEESAAAASLTHHSPLTTHHSPLTTHQVGMLCFLVTEVAFFATLIVVYLFYMSQSRDDARAMLSLPLVVVSSICLLSSSITIHKATGALPGGAVASFRLWWGATIVLGGLFLAATGYEWAELIGHHKLTMARSVFGTTYFTLVGFHAAHVTIGLLLLLVVLGYAWVQERRGPWHMGAELIAWYWHFVDGVWVVVVCVVYLLGR